MEQQFNNKVFGISFPDNQLQNIEDEFELKKEIEDEDVQFYLSKQTFKHEDDPDYTFEYQYGIEAYPYKEENGKQRVGYALYLIPTFNFLSKKKQENVSYSTGESNPDTMDVFDYGISLVFGRELIDGEYDKSVMDKIASVIGHINSLMGFYLDMLQNRIGTTGWMMLDDYLNDNDAIKATLSKYKK